MEPRFSLPKIKHKENVFSIELSKEMNREDCMWFRCKTLFCGFPEL